MEKQQLTRPPGISKEDWELAGKLLNGQLPKERLSFDAWEEKLLKALQKEVNWRIELMAAKEWFGRNNLERVDERLAYEQDLIRQSRKRLAHFLLSPHAGKTDLLRLSQEFAPKDDQFDDL